MQRDLPRCQFLNCLRCLPDQDHLRLKIFVLIFDFYDEELKILSSQSQLGLWFRILFLRNETDQHELRSPDQGCCCPCHLLR